MIGFLPTLTRFFSFEDFDEDPLDFAFNDFEVFNFLIETSFDKEDEESLAFDEESLDLDFVDFEIFNLLEGTVFDEENSLLDEREDESSTFFPLPFLCQALFLDIWLQVWLSKIFL